MLEEKDIFWMLLITFENVTAFSKLSNMNWLEYLTLKKNQLHQIIEHKI